MQWNNHFGLEGRHAFLSASQYHWLGYDEEKLINTYKNYLGIEMGTRLHAFAAECINLGQKLPSRPKKTLSLYVNDAIGFRLRPEQILYYSENAFGTADAISFRDGFLRIHDLKTGKTPASMKQLKVYAALFCLEYNVKPGDIEMELRIYQNDEVLIDNPTAEDILPIMDKIITFDKCIDKVKEIELR